MNTPLTDSDFSDEKMATKMCALFFDPGCFSGKPTENPTDFVTHYRRVARANGWEDANALRVFPMFLKGKAEKWFEGLGARQATLNTLDALTAALEEAFKTVASEDDAEEK